MWYEVKFFLVLMSINCWVREIVKYGKKVFKLRVLKFLVLCSIISVEVFIVEGFFFKC